MKNAQTFCKYLYREDDKGIIFLNTCSLFIILISYLLTSLNAQATMHCHICGVGEYKKLKHKDYLNFPKSEAELCLDVKKLIPYEDTYSCKKNTSLPFEESHKEYLVKCSHCAELLYINGFHHNNSASTINCTRRVCPIIGICACAACSLAIGGFGVHLCQLKNTMSYVVGGSYFIASSLYGWVSCSLAYAVKESLKTDKRRPINNKIQEILGIKCISDTKDNIAMIIDSENKDGNHFKEIHGDGCFFHTIVNDQIKAFHNTSVGNSDIRTITKEEVMVFALHEIWAKNRDNNIGEYKKTQTSALSNFHKARNCELDKQSFPYLKTAHTLSISPIFIDNYNYATASESNININTKDYVPGQIDYHNDIQSNKLLLIKTQLTAWAEDHETIKSFILSITFKNNGSIQILFDKDKEIGNGWNIHYPELLGDNNHNISLDNMIKIFDFLSDYDNKLNYKDVKIIIPEVLSLD